MVKKRRRKGKKKKIKRKKREFVYVTKMGPKKTGWSEGGYYRHKERRNPLSGVEIVRPQKRKVGKHFYGKDVIHEEKKLVRNVSPIEIRKAKRK